MSTDPKWLANWFIFGEDPKTGLVDLADQDGDLLWAIPRKLAEAIVVERDKFILSNKQARSIYDRVAAAMRAKGNRDET